MSAQELEPWLRETHLGLPVILRGVLHAYEQAEEDILRWCGPLTDAEIHATLHSLPSVAFQMRHIVRSLDRLLTYAEGKPLDDVQAAALKAEHLATGSTAQLLQEFAEGIPQAKNRLLGFAPEEFDRPRGIGRALIPATVGGILIHSAEHTQRHVGQAITTAKMVAALR